MKSLLQFHVPTHLAPVDQCLRSQHTRSVPTSSKTRQPWQQIGYIMIYHCNSMFIKLGPYNLSQCWLVVPLLKNGDHFRFSYTSMVASDPVAHSVHFYHSLNTVHLVNQSYYLLFKISFQKGKVTLQQAKIHRKILSTTKNIIYKALIFKIFLKHFLNNFAYTCITQLNHLVY